MISRWIGAASLLIVMTACGAPAQDGAARRGARGRTPSPLPCVFDGDCAAGSVCRRAVQCGEASSCGAPRACEREAPVEVCGCDGVTFRTRPSCPDRPFARLGRCATSAATTAGRAPTASAESPADETVEATMPAPDGPTCEDSEDCAEGTMCLGPRGCGMRWACGAVPNCSRTLVAFCDCDGATFFASANCPGRPYAHRGRCQDFERAEEFEPLPNDAVCSASDQCRRGQMCRGLPGCRAIWTCDRVRRCGRTEVEYCGCDGATFRARERCPGRPYLHKGSCRAPTAAPP